MVKLVIDSNEKEEIASIILNNLPEWFGLPDSTEKYINDSKSMPFWAFIKEKPMGFIVLNETSDSTAEIYKLEVFPNMWDKWNPCQIYVKYIGNLE